MIQICNACNNDRPCVLEDSCASLSDSCHIEDDGSEFSANWQHIKDVDMSIADMLKIAVDTFDFQKEQSGCNTADSPQLAQMRKALEAIQ